MDSFSAASVMDGRLSSSQYHKATKLCQLGDPSPHVHFGELCLTSIGLDTLR